MPTTHEQADFAHGKFLVFCSLQPTKSACSAAAEKCLSGVGQPLSSVSGRKRYNTLDFASKIVCQQGCFSPLLETQSQGATPLWTPCIFSSKMVSKLKKLRFLITDMIEFNGNIYLSAYAVPRTVDRDASSRYEIEGVLRYLFDNDIWEISSEELTPMVRDNYTALLLVCEPETGKPQEFYSVKGSLGGKLAVSDTGNLLWDVESITSTFFSPATSSFTIGGTSYVFRYAFDTSGLLISQEKTDEVVNFHR